MHDPAVYRKVVLATGITIGLLCLPLSPIFPADDLFDDDGPTGNVDDRGRSSDTPGGTPGEEEFLPSHLGPIGRVDERLDNEACDDCFTVPGLSEEGRYQIFESVAVEGNTERIIPRRIPNPAPVAEGETRPTTDGDEALWYIGSQAYSGPRDTDPVSSLLPNKTLIALKRIHAKKSRSIMKIDGVHAFGLNAAGFEVHIAKGFDKTKIPSTIEGIPVVVNVEARAQMAGHESSKFRPVPTGAGIYATHPGTSTAWTGGTLGPHIVRTSGGCCTIWSLTAAHVARQNLDSTPPTHGTIDFYQPYVNPLYEFGQTTVVFRLRSCGTVANRTNCDSASPIANEATEAPDVAAIDPYPYGQKTIPPSNYPIDTDPTRHLQEAWDDYTNGPSGVIRSSRFGNTHRIWGAYGGKTTGVVSGTNLDVEIEFGGDIYLFHGVHRLTINPLNGPKSGDSGAAVTFKGTGNRHVAGVFFAHGPLTAWYSPAADIKTAFSGAGYAFSHYWGTKSGYRLPATSTCDEPDGC